MEKFSQNSNAWLEKFIRKESGAAGFVENWNVNLSGKQAIARYIAKHFTQNELIALDAGSTSYEIAKALKKQVVRKGFRVLTNNIAISLCLMGSNVDCTLVGGPVDPYHFCTLPGEKVLDTPDLEHTDSWQAVLTAASIGFSDSGIGIRARKPDQFTFKKALIKIAPIKIVAIDHTKLTLPFDGQNEFQIFEPGVHIVIDRLPTVDDDFSIDFAQVCKTFGYHLHIAS